MRLISSMLVTLALGCATTHSPSVESYRAGQRDAALDDQKDLAGKPGKDQALEQLRLASMALALGDEALSEEALRGAVATMTNFHAEGEFAALVASESKKEWKGEPYEKMAAFLTLGTLLHAGGDMGNALAMYKSSILADTGTKEERFRSDFVPGWTMQALAYAAEGERDNAEQYMNRAIDARWSRDTISLLSNALGDVTVAKADPSGLNGARAILLAAMAGGVSAKPRDPQEAVRATLSHASDLLIQQRKLKGKERLPTLQNLSRRDLDRAGDVLPALAEAWAAKVGELPASATSQSQAFADHLMGLISAPPSTVLLVERGRGPKKVRAGDYGQILRISPGYTPRSGLVAQVEPVASGRNAASRAAGDQAPLAIPGPPPQLSAVWLDDLSYQATTRGGRAVDGFLQGKAVYKDASIITGYVLLEVAQGLAHTDNDQAAAAAAIIGLALMVSGAVTNPAADIRQWEFAPGEWWLVTGHLTPGDQTLHIDGRTYTASVPERGQLVDLVPSLSPGGSPQLRGR